MGPWTKYAGNPLMEATTVGGNGFYIASMMRVDGTYIMYTEAPINDYDYGPIARYTAKRPEGPWVAGDRPVLTGGDLGQWSGGDMSESRVLYDDGVYHLFYSAGPGPARHPTRRRLLGAEHEEIGYAFSLDCVHFEKNLHNPVAIRALNPGIGRMSESHVFIQGGIFYLYHTIAWTDVDGGASTRGYTDLENLGVQVLVQNQAFRLTWPVLAISELPSGAATNLSLTSPLNLDHVAGVSLTLRYRCSGQIRVPDKAGFQVNAVTSSDGVAYDSCTTKFCAFMAKVDFPGNCDGGTVMQRPVTFKTQAGWIDSFPGRFVKFQVQNSATEAVLSDVDLTATIVGKDSVVGG